jgi:hypothetical protein
MITPEEASQCDAIVAHDQLTQDLHKAVLDCGSLTVVCAWCGAHISGPKDKVKSHGCCQACATEWKKGLQ